MASRLPDLHREAQLAVRAETIADLSRLWPTFDINAVVKSWANLEPALIAIVRTRGEQSANLAAAFYAAIRSEAVGPMVPIVATPTPVEQIARSLRGTGPARAMKLVTEGRTDAAKVTFTETLGNATRLVLNHGRETTMVNIAADPATPRWRRVTSGNPCKFCRMLASRGAVYSADTVSFQAHNHCSCIPAPEFEQTLAGTGTPTATGPQITSAPPVADVRSSRVITSWDDLTSWAAEYDIDLKVDQLAGAGVDPADLEPLARAVDDIAMRYPAIPDYIAQVDFRAGGLGEGASVGSHRGIFRPLGGQSDVHIHGNRGRWLGNKEPTWGRVHSTPENMYDVWLHELGHVMHNGTPYMRPDAAKYMPGKKVRIISDAMKRAGYKDGRGSKRRDLIGGDVSEYAASDDQEFFAEVFAMFNRPGGIADLPVETRERLLLFRDAVNELAGATVL